MPVLEAAVAAGASAVVLTSDTPFPGTKYAADAEDWTGIDLDWWRVNFADPKPDRWARDLTAADVTWLRERAGVPVVVKGVLRGDDALRCLHAGADAVYVSNHGGRQLDRAVPTAHALREVVAAVGDRADVYVDGGIRSGLDALAALALGARGVFVGRPALYGLAVDGARGVDRVLRDLETELREALELAGCATLDEARDLLAAPSSTGPLTCADARAAPPAAPRFASGSSRPVVFLLVARERRGARSEDRAPGTGGHQFSPPPFTWVELLRV